jgi:hypothetical protein
MPELSLQTVVFHEPKPGAPDSEWEDGAGHRAADPETGGPDRLVVVDGATTAYDALHWVAQLVGSFIGPDGPPALAPDDLDLWFGLMQERWAEQPREFRNVYAEHKFSVEGSFATFLGCDVHLSDQHEPHWRGAALGDAVLFHVRGGQVVAQLPTIAADGFGYNPDGVFTQPSERDRMRSGLAFEARTLQAGDVLYLTTDALAHWLLKTAAEGRDCWREVAGIEHPRVFRRWVAEQRDHGMKEDDVTMLRAEVAAGDVEVLVLCR